MPLRIQKTPHGDVNLTSRWQRDRFYLCATGPTAAVQWMFPKAHPTPVSPGSVRHEFAPASEPVRVERDLRRLCGRWQEKWEDLLHGYVQPSVPAEPTQEPAITTLGHLFDHLWAVRKAQVAVITADRDRYKLNLWRTELGEHRELSTLTPDLITQALARIGKRTSPSTGNAALGLLKTYLTWGSRADLLKDTCFRNIQRLKGAKGTRHHRKWWTTDQVEQALACARADPHQPTATLLVACGCFLGLRVEEIIMQRWQDLDLDGKDPTTGVPRPVCHVTPHSGWTPKDGEARDIPIATPLLAILQEHRQSDGYLLQAEPHRHGRPRNGQGWIYRYNPKKVWARIMKRVQAAGGSVITMYGMRHSFASNLLIAGISDVKVSRWLGHSDTRMVHRHYGHLLSYDQDINALVAKANQPLAG